MADKPLTPADRAAIKRIADKGKALSPKKPPQPQKKPGHARDDQ